MSDVSMELSGGLPQQLDSLISNSAWMADTGRLNDFYLCTLRWDKSWNFYLWIQVWAPFKTLLFVSTIWGIFVSPKWTTETTTWQTKLTSNRLIWLGASNCIHTIFGGYMLTKQYKIPHSVQQCGSGFGTTWKGIINWINQNCYMCMCNTVLTTHIS